MKLGAPTMLSHVAYITHDTAATVRFYRELLGMELVNAVLDDSIPSTGDPVPVLPLVLPDGRRLDGGLLRGARAAAASPGAPSGLRRLPALGAQVDCQRNGRRVADWLVENDVDVLGPVDHKIIYSIYFHDPNGLRLEITTPLDPHWNDMADQALASLEAWEQVKAEARSSGRDMVTVLTELTHERSHRRASGLTID